MKFVKSIRRRTVENLFFNLIFFFFFSILLPGCVRRRTVRSYLAEGHGLGKIPQYDVVLLQNYETRHQIGHPLAAPECTYIAAVGKQETVAVRRRRRRRRRLIKLHVA